MADRYSDDSQTRTIVHAITIARAPPQPQSLANAAPHKHNHTQRETDKDP